MDSAIIVLQVVIALGITNVWVVRFGKATAWRGGAATDLRGEFAAYGLPSWCMWVIGALKLSCAAALVVGIWKP